jgi:uncharacterized protein YodC (DUF2158 family)
MSDEQIKLGDVVQLKSGGPGMTVERLYRSTSGEEKAECLWFDGTQPKSGQFALTSLVAKTR